MKKIMILAALFFVFASFAAASSPCASATVDEALSSSSAGAADTGEDLYKKQNWKGAFEFYKDRIDSGSLGWEERYNAGNCLFRMGKYPGARLFYLRAKKIKPRSGDINYNLKVVREKLGVTEEPKSVSSAFAAFFTADEFKTAVIFFTWLFFITAVIYVLTKREFALWASAAFFVIDAFAYGALYAKINGGPEGGSGIVMREESMQSGPGGSYKVIASVPAGMKADIYDEEDEWFFVRVARSGGWIRKNAIEKID